MVRNGVVSHPSEWSFGGYREIQKPRQKNALIAYQKLAELTGFKDYTAFQETHQALVHEALVNDNNFRQHQWTESIAVGSKGFIESIQEKLGMLAKGRKIHKNNEGFHLREKMGTYIVNSESKNEAIGSNNTYHWDANVHL